MGVKNQENGSITSWQMRLDYRHDRSHLEKISDQDRTKRIASGKRDLFFHYSDAKDISFYNFRDIKFCAKHEKDTWIPFILLDLCLYGK